MAVSGPTMHATPNLHEVASKLLVWPLLGFEQGIIYQFPRFGESSHNPSLE